MKKKIITLIIGITVAATFAGCGKISNDKITIEKYKGIEVQKIDPIEVTDAAIEQSINSTLQAKATEVKDRAVEMGDIAVLDYVGKKDGVEFEGGAATDAPLTIGSGDFIDGFEEGVIGHKIGETFDLNLKFPENYPNSPDLAGKDVVFTVTVKGIKDIPELTDEYVKELSKKSTTVEEFKKEVKADLEKSNEETAESQFEGVIWDELIKKCKVDKYPEDKVKTMTDNINEQYGPMAQMYGLEDAEALLTQVYGLTVDELVKNSITQEFAVELIAEKEKLTVSKKEYKAGLKKYAEQFGYEKPADLEKEIGKENIEKTLLQEKVTDWLVDNCKKVEKKESK